MNSAPLDDLFTRRIVEVHGELGRAWLDVLPALLAEMAGRWNLRIGPAVDRLSYNFVCAAVRADGSPAMFKAGVPDSALTSDIEALSAYGGRGAARLLERDEEAGVMLLERVEPGTTLLSLLQSQHDEWATDVAASVMRNLHSAKDILPTNYPFRTVDSWAVGLGRLRATFGGSTGPFPPEIVERAEGLFKDLLATANGPVLLHGDLHHENILESRDRGYLAIDPEGVIGEPAFEAGAYLRNPLPDILNEDSVSFHLRRIKQLADGMGVDRERVRDWAVAQAVLSGWWSYEDHGTGWEPAIRLAQLLSHIYLY